MYQTDKCEKCLSPDHEGNFCRCESRNMWVARELRKAGKSPWGKDACRISGCRNFATICINCGREVCTKTFNAPNEWISIKDQFPPFEGIDKCSYVLAYHTIHKVGVAWFWTLRQEEENDGIVQEMEEDFKDTYLCSCRFILNKTDGNDCIDDERIIDIFSGSPHFRNLGTVTHWMPLPKPPEET